MNDPIPAARIQADPEEAQREVSGTGYISRVRDLQVAKKNRAQAQAKLEQALSKAADSRLGVKSQIRPAIETVVMAGADFATGHSITDIIIMMGPPGVALTEEFAKNRKAAAECDRLNRELAQCDKIYRDGVTALKKDLKEDLATGGAVVAAAVTVAAGTSRVLDFFQKKRT